MIFLNAILAGGLAAVSVPIIVHIIHRRRVKRIDWGAMRFLVDMLARSKRRMMVEHWLLLCIRMAMLACLGLYTGGAALWIFYSLLPQGEDIARTAAFTGMVVFEKASVFAFRSFTTSCTRLGWLSNRVLIIALVVTLGLQVAAVNFGPLQLMLHTAPLGWDEWQTIGLLALPLIIVPEIVKMVRQPRHAAA